MTASRIRILAVLLLAAAATTACRGERAQPRPGRFLVYTKDLNKATQALWIARVDGSHSRVLVRHAAFGALSPDGRWVAYDRCLGPRERCQTGDAPFALYLIATSGGKPRLLARSASYPQWSPTSDRLIALRKNTLVSLNLDGNVRALEESRALRGWSFSPDGKWLVYAKARQHARCASDLFVVPATGGEERRLTHGRDIFPVWGRHWIAFSRYPRSCAFARRIWRIGAAGREARPVTVAPPPGYSRNGYYGFDPVAWTPDEGTLLAGLASEWGDEAIRLDVATGSFRKLSGYALNLSRDGRVALVTSGGVEPPYTISAVTLADGKPRVLVRGDVDYANWNR